MRLLVGQRVPYDTTGIPNTDSPTLINMGIGGAAIIRNNDSTVLSNAFTQENLEQLVFNSYNFDYLSINEVITVNNIYLPERNPLIVTTGGKRGGSFKKPHTGIAKYLVKSLPGNYTPITFGFCITTGKALSTSTLYANGDSFRVISLNSSTTEVSISEVYYIGNTGLPALNLSFSIMICDQGIDSSQLNTSDKAFYADPNRVILGNGKIDSTRDYIIMNPSGFAFNIAPSIEMSLTTDVVLFYGQRLTSAATRLRTYENGNIITSIQNAYGIWQSANGGDWPYIITPGTTVGISRP